MDQRELYPDFGGAPNGAEARRIGFNARDARDLQTGGVAASDGDGTMLGRVLIYVSIVVVAAAVIVWNLIA